MQSLTDQGVFSAEQAEKLPFIGYLKNNWRQRDVSIYQHPRDPELVVTVGVPRCANPMRVVTVEHKSAYAQAIAKFPDVAIYD